MPFLEAGQRAEGSWSRAQEKAGEVITLAKAPWGSENRAYMCIRGKTGALWPLLNEEGEEMMSKVITAPSS